MAPITKVSVTARQFGDTLTPSFRASVPPPDPLPLVADVQITIGDGHLMVAL